MCCNLIFIFPLSPSYSQGQWCSRCERERTNLFTTQTRTVLFAVLLQSRKWLPCTNAQSDVLFAGHLYFLLWRLINLNFSEAWSESTNMCRDLQNFKPMESRDVHQNFCLQRHWHFVFRIFKSLDAGDVHQNFCLQNLQHLIRNSIFRSWDCSSELPVSESSTWFLGKALELSEADFLHDQKHDFRSALRCYCCAFNFWWSDFCLNVRICFKHSCSKR